MLHTFYNQGFTDALRHFPADVDKLAQFGAAGGTAGGRATNPAGTATAQPMTPPTMPPAAPGPAALPSAPVAPRAQPTL